MGECFSLHILPDDVRSAVGESGQVVEGNDVGMAQLLRKLRFVTESRQEVIDLRELRMHELDGAISVELQVPGPVDDVHASTTENGLDDISIIEDIADAEHPARSVHNDS